MQKFHFFFPPGYALSKVHEVVSFYFRGDEDTTFHENVTVTKAHRFLTENAKNENLCVVFYIHPSEPIWERSIAGYLHEMDGIKLKVLFVTFDFWYRGDIYRNYLRRLFPPKNYYVSTFAPSLKVLNSFHGRKDPYRPDRIILSNVWACYRASFVPFNTAPKNMVGVSGTVSLHYPERGELLHLAKLTRKNLVMKHHIERIPVDKQEWQSPLPLYNWRLNQYICCFASTVHVMKPESKPVYPTGIVLLKNFEILASGSLLLCPSNQIQALSNLGLVEGTHYIARAMKDMFDIIVWICNPTNREEVDKIRAAGQQFARENLTTEQKYKELKQLWIKRLFL